MYAVSVDLVFDKEVVDVNVPGISGTGVPPVLLHLHSTLIVLMKMLDVNGYPWASMK